MDEDRIHNLGIGIFGLSTALASLLDSIGVNYRDLRLMKQLNIPIPYLLCTVH